MKTKQFYLTGLLALATIGGASAQAQANEAVAFSIDKHTISAPLENAMFTLPQTLDLGIFSPAADSEKLREAAILMSLKADVSATTESKFVSPVTSIEDLAKELFDKEAVAKLKAADAEITESSKRKA